MTRQEVFGWCKQQYSTESEYPWNEQVIEKLLNLAQQIAAAHKEGNQLGG